MAILRQGDGSSEGPFAQLSAVEGNHDSPVGGGVDRTGRELLVLSRVQQEQGGGSGGEDISGHVAEEQAPSWAAPVARKGDQPRASVLHRVGGNGTSGSHALHVLRLHANSLRLEADSQSAQVVVRPHGRTRGPA